MRVRLLADRELYASYANRRDPTGSLFILDGQTGEGRADVEVMPAERLIALPARLRPRSPVFAYGPVSLMGAAYEAGCQDYLRDPWSLAELRARALRLESLRFAAGGLELELRGSLLAIRGREQGPSATLNEAERRLLRLLIQNSGNVVSRQTMVLDLWGNTERCGRTIDVYIARLRTKICLVAPHSEGLISVCRGIGYRLQSHTCG